MAQGAFRGWKTEKRWCRYRGCYRVSPSSDRDGGKNDKEGGDSNGRGWKTIAGANSRISYAEALCFAWPRQYYYHIFRIMRPRVCLLFHAAPSDPPIHPRSEATKREIERARTKRLNVLSFIARAAAFYGGCEHPRWKVYTLQLWPLEGMISRTLLGRNLKIIFTTSRHICNYLRIKEFL